MVKRAAAGDDTAFEQLVITYQTAIYHLCLRMSGSPDDAADLTQEVFLKAWRNLESFHFEAAFSTWLYRLASNTCLDYLRAVKRRPQISMTVQDADGDVQTMDFPDQAPSPEDAVISAQEHEQVQAALRTLDPEQRQILILRVYDDLSYTEIAEILNLREGTVKSRISRAREQLRKKLLQNGNKKKAETSNRQKRKGGGS